MTNDTNTIIFELLHQLSTEIDLHYEDEDFFALAETIEPMRSAADLLTGANHSLPGSYQHVLARFLRQRN